MTTETKHQYVKVAGTCEYGNDAGIGRVEYFQNSRVYAIWPERNDARYSIALCNAEFVGQDEVNKYCEFLESKYGNEAINMIVSLLGIDGLTEEGSDIILHKIEETIL